VILLACYLVRDVKEDRIYATNADCSLYAATNGEEVADYLLEAARKNQGTVKFDSCPSKICLEPPGGLAMPAAQRLHGMPVAFEESIDRKGVWSLSLESAGSVYVYAIEQNKIFWRSRGDDVYRELTVCPSKMYIDFSAEPPSFSVK